MEFILHGFSSIVQFTLGIIWEKIDKQCDFYSDETDRYRSIEGLG